MPAFLRMKAYKKHIPYKQTTWVPHWNDVETVVSTLNPRGVFVGLIDTFEKQNFTLIKFYIT